MPHFGSFAWGTRRPPRLDETLPVETIGLPEPPVAAPIPKRTLAGSSCSSGASRERAVGRAERIPPRPLSSPPWAMSLPRLPLLDDDLDRRGTGRRFGAPFFVSLSMSAIVSFVRLG